MCKKVNHSFYAIDSCDSYNSRYEYDTEAEGWYQDERGEWHQDPAYAQYYEEYYKQFYEYQELQQQRAVQNNGENDAQPRKNSTNSLSKVCISIVYSVTP